METYYLKCVIILNQISTTVNKSLIVTKFKMNNYIESNKEN